MLSTSMVLIMLKHKGIAGQLQITKGTSATQRNLWRTVGVPAHRHMVQQRSCSTSSLPESFVPERVQLSCSGP